MTISKSAAKAAALTGLITLGPPFAFGLGADAATAGQVNDLAEVAALSVQSSATSTGLYPAVTVQGTMGGGEFRYVPDPRFIRGGIPTDPCSFTAVGEVGIAMIEAKVVNTWRPISRVILDWPNFGATGPRRV